MRLAGKVACVTGGSRGQGAAECRLFVEHGARVAIADVLEEEGRALAAELGDAAIFMALDVSDAESWRSGVDAMEKALGPISILVNNAAIRGAGGGAADANLEDFKAVIAVNQIGTFLGMQTVVPSMRRAGGGSIVNVSSTGGLTGVPGILPYCSTKWAVRGMTRCAALDLGPEIRVNLVCPGPVDTPMVRPPSVTSEEFNSKFVDRVALQRAATAPEVALAVLFLACDESSFMTGAELAVDGGMTAGNRQDQSSRSMFGTT
jgi:3alpha(or 20beta)-hydroxysteroid dehydrogenase